jgi:single-stranded-DNA-specific exonuclease
MKKQWNLKPKADPKLIAHLQESLGVAKIVAQLLVQRGITDFKEAKSFFRPTYDQLHDPFLMKDMTLAVNRLKKALEQKENILIYGDYDVDGTTAVALMYSFLKSIHPNVAYYIPDRYSEGYGISYQGIDYAAQNNFSLIIALDCGIKAVDKVAYAQEKEIDFIICDHHRPGANVPKALAVLDPKQNDCKYPYKELSGCGVGFKLIQAYCQKNNIAFEKITHYLDLLVVSIAADIVPITEENRVLAYYGLKQLSTEPRKGLKALMEVSDKEKNLTISDVVFGLAPRINAAGRIEHGAKAVALLVQEDIEQARSMAQKVNEHNLKRRELDQSITQEALKMVIPNAKSTVVYQENWHKGVVGIVASRLIETHYRPTIVLTENNGMLAGSARSVKGFDIYNAIGSCSEYIEQFGGHKYAAGLTLKKEKLAGFTAKFEEVVSATIQEEMLNPQISIDAELTISEINPKLYRILKQMAPFGPGNMSPIFMTQQVIDRGYGRKIGQEQTHLKLNVGDKEPTQYIDCIGFGMADKFELIKEGQQFDIAYAIEENVWNGNVNLQLRLKDIRS